MQDRETALAQFEVRVQIMEQRLAGMKAVTKAAGDLYGVLDPDQNRSWTSSSPSGRCGAGVGKGADRDQRRCRVSQRRCRVSQRTRRLEQADDSDDDE